MAQYISAAQLQVDSTLYGFINDVLAQHPHKIDAAAFWQGFSDLVHTLAPQNRALLAKRDQIQLQLDEWHRNHPGPIADMAAYKTFLNELDYLVDTPLDFHEERFVESPIMIMVLVNWVRLSTPRIPN